MIKREIELPLDYSFFLFGPRGTGKSTWLSHTFPDDQTYIVDLLDTELLSRLEQSPQLFYEMIESLPASVRWVVIDEVQLLPILLNEVHRFLEKNDRFLFALTGSNARKLKKGEANLLAGRAFSFNLHPLTASEIGTPFNLEEAMQFGTLPKLLQLSTAKSKERFLKAYTQTYLKEEIQMEGVVRNLRGFKQFLRCAALENGMIVNFANLARESGVDAKTIKAYFDILEDTLLGFMLPAYHRSIRKRQRTHPKFYLFDCGVQRALTDMLKVPLIPGSSNYGRAFEHFIILELMRQNQYKEADYQFSYLASPSMEIDLVIERPNRPTVLIEIKSTQKVTSQHLKHIKSVLKEYPQFEGICISNDRLERESNHIKVIHWSSMIKTIML